MHYIHFSLTPEEHREFLSATILHPDITPIQGLFIEAFITFALVTTIFGSTNDNRKDAVLNPSVPIGFAVAFGTMSAVSYCNCPVLTTGYALQIKE